MHRDLMQKNRPALLRLSFFAVIGSGVAAWIGIKTPDFILSVAFGIFLMAFGIFFWRSQSHALAQVSTRLRQSSADFFMVLAGVSSGFFGIGGGIITVPVLHHLLLFPMKECTKLSFFVQFFATGIGLLVYYHTRKEVIYQLPPSTLAFLLLGSLIGFFLSRKVKATNEILKKLFAVLLVLVGATKLYGSIITSM